MAAGSSFLERLKGIGLSPHNVHEPVYKYTDVDTAIKILSNNSVRFRTPATFNDPLEFNPDCLCYEVSQDDYEKKLHFDLQQCEGFSEFEARDSFIKSKTVEEYQRAYRTAIETSRHRFLVFYASSAYDNTLMWTHYGRNHTGVCFGISLPHFDEELRSLSLKVNYAINIEPKKVITFDETEKSLALYYWIYTKSRVWDYEDEVRTIINLDEIGIDLKGMDYQDVSLAEGQLCSIYYGYLTPQCCIDIMEAIIKENGYNMKRYLMQPVTGTFKFEATPYSQL